MTLENWNEFSETVVNYVEQLTASEDPDDVFIANMVKRWITRGTESPRDQLGYPRASRIYLQVMQTAR